MWCFCTFSDAVDYFMVPYGTGLNRCWEKFENRHHLVEQKECHIVLEKSSIPNRSGRPMYYGGMDDSLHFLVWRFHIGHTQTAESVQRWLSLLLHCRDCQHPVGYILIITDHSLMTSVNGLDQCSLLKSAANVWLCFPTKVSPFAILWYY